MPFCSATCSSTARLVGKTAVITGCNTGIGKETAKDLYRRGARVILACRNITKAQEATEDIKSQCKDLNADVGELAVAELDLCSLTSVRKCAQKLLQEERHIEILINNAGVMMCPMERTDDGFEMQIGTNHFGHFLLTCLLLPRLIESKPSRVVVVSSLAHKQGAMDFDDLNFEKRSYGSIKAYGQSKLANILFVKELDRKLKAAGIEDVTVYSLHPGVIQTELGRHLNTTVFPGARQLFRFFGAPFVKTPVQGAQTTIHCAVSDEAAKESGLYYAECVPTACSSQASNEEDAQKLWAASLKLVHVEDPFDKLNK